MTFNIKSAALGIAILALGNGFDGFEKIANSPAWIATVLTYAVATTLLNSWVTKAATQSPIKFTTAVYGATTVKMLSSLVIITFYLVFKMPDPKQFAFGVFGVFLAYSVLFVISSQKLVRKG